MNFILSFDYQGSRPGAIRGPPKQPVNPNLPTDDDNDSDDW